MTRCWLNGRIVEQAQARIDPADRGFTLGDGVFETLRVVDGRAAHLARHLARLRHGAAVLGIEVPAADAVIGDAVAELAAAGVGTARITLTRGAAPRGVLPREVGAPTLLIQLGSGQPPADRVAAILCRTTRRNEHSPLAGIKSLNYLDSILARREARAVGADEAILLNTVGDVAEACAANVFVWRSGRLCTSRLRDGALPGIARSLLIERAGAMEERLTVEDLRRAEAVMLANSLGVSAVGSLDGRGYAAVRGLVEWMRGLLD